MNDQKTNEREFSNQTEDHTDTRAHARPHTRSQARAPTRTLLHALKIISFEEEKYAKPRCLMENVLDTGSRGLGSFAYE